MGIGKGLLDTLVNPVVWRRIRQIGRVRLASTAGEDADDATISVRDGRPGTPRGGETAALGAVRVDGYLYGCRANAVAVVFPDEGFNTLDSPAPVVGVLNLGDRTKNARGDGHHQQTGESTIRNYNALAR